MTSKRLSKIGFVTSLFVSKKRHQEEDDLAVGFHFLGASQAIITFTDKESMEKELKDVCSVMKNSFIRFKPWEQKVKATDQICLGVHSGTTVGHNTSSTQETSLVNKPVRSWATGLNISSAQETSPSSKPMRPKNSDQLYNKRLVPKYSYNKRKKVKKDRCVLAYDGISAEDLEFPVTNISDHQKDTSLKDTSLSPVTRSAADEREERNPNHASTEEEVRGTESAGLFRCEKENNAARSKTRKLKMLTASGRVANTTEESVSVDSLNLGIQQGNVRYQITCNNNQADGFDKEKEFQEMIQDAVTLGLGNPRDLTAYEDGIWSNIDREVDEWTSINRL
uniref:Uncharacterized protein n=1 Tax=Populus trichocarpa TaxID=3694 RepID=A0A2K2A379_POPTR